MFDFYPDFLGASLKMGVDVMPETDPETVPHTKTPGYQPTYAYQAYEKGEWLPPVEVPTEQLPEIVDRMHWDFKEFVRLLEDGHPIFGCEVI